MASLIRVLLAGLLVVGFVVAAPVADPQQDGNFGFASDGPTYDEPVHQDPASSFYQPASDDSSHAGPQDYHQDQPQYEPAYEPASPYDFQADETARSSDFDQPAGQEDSEFSTATVAPEQDGQSFSQPFLPVFPGHQGSGSSFSHDNADQGVANVYSSHQK
ncbi:uncharacterized protein LOC135113398 [Scylla paramamosain]|uniref:uncharacterized protein LOC135113398 n=1 Tax=Scylla paramamosain TaxID=85552 RepID=UPI003083E5B6